MNSLKTTLKRIDDMRNTINNNRPLSIAEVAQLRDFYRVGLTFTSNALEGNSLTLTETKVLLEDRITITHSKLRRKKPIPATLHSRS